MDTQGNLESWQSPKVSSSSNRNHSILPVIPTNNFLVIQHTMPASPIEVPLLELWSDHKVTHRLGCPLYLLSPPLPPGTIFQNKFWLAHIFPSHATLGETFGATNMQQTKFWIWYWGNQSGKDLTTFRNLDGENLYW